MRDGAFSAQVVFCASTAAAATWTNMPAADTLLFGSHRHVALFDVDMLSRARLKVNKQATAGASGAVLTLRYSPTFSTNVASYKDIGVTPVQVAINVANAFLDSGWIDLADEVRGYDDVYLAIVGSGGDGAVDPTFGFIGASFH